MINGLSAAVAVLFAGTAATAAWADGGALRIRINADIRSTEPGVNRDGNSDAIVLNIVEGLVGYKDDATVAPLLAQSIDISADGKTYTFKLREGVTFSNGEPLTSADVLFSWQHYTRPESGWRCLSDVNGKGIANVTSVEAPDASTVVFKLEKPTALFLNTLARTDCGSTGIVHKSSTGADGKWAAPVGTGPFALGEWKAGQYVELKRNDKYKPLSGKIDGYVGDKTPKVDTVRFVIVPDDSAATAGILSGDIDILPDVGNATVAQLKDNPQATLQIVPGMSLNALLFQTKDSLLKDVRIREALRLSLDLAQIAESVTEGLAEASNSVIPKASPYFKEKQAAVPQRDIEKAKALLAEAGYDGRPIKWLATEFYPSLSDAAILVQAMAQEAGINLQIEVLDWATLLDRYTAGNYGAMSFTYSARLDPTLSYIMVSGDKAAQPNKVWDNPEGLKLITQSGAEADPAKRQAMFDKLEDMIRADVPIIPLYSGSRVGAVRKGVEGYVTWPVGSPRAWGVTVPGSN